MKKFFCVFLTCVLLISIFGCEKAPTLSQAELTVDLDLTAEWNRVSGTDSLVQGCLVVRKEFALAHPTAVANFLNSYRSSVEFLSEHPEDAAQLIAQEGLFASAAVAKEAIPNCNITYMDGDAMQVAMNHYLSVLYEIAPASIGGSIPGADFYYAPDEEATAEQSPASIRVYTLNGTTGFGMAKLMSEKRPDLTFTVRADASDVTAALLGKEADIAALPTNAAANLYNKTGGEVLLLAVNTKGCLYLLNGTGEKIKSFADLKGKTVYVPAQNPTFIFQYLCRENGLTVGEDIFVNSESYAVASNLKDAVAAGIVKLAVLPEPMVTVAKSAYGKS